MSESLPPEIFQQLVRFIQPFMTDSDSREAWLTEAFYLRDPRPFSQLDRSGSPHVFSVRCIQTLNELGCLAATNGTKYAYISALLQALRPECSLEKQQEIDKFLNILGRQCVEAVAPSVSLAPPERTAIPVPRIQSIETDLQDRAPTVFLSYSHVDTAFVQRLIADLQQAGHAVWLDTSSIKGGDQWLRAIAEGIINSYAFVLVATRQSLKSQWVQDEILWAKQRGKRIISVLLEEVTKDIGFFPLVNYQGVKFYEVDYAAAIQNLLRGLPAPCLEGAHTPPISAPRLVSQRELELQYLERLNLENWLTTIKRVEQYTTLTGTAQTSKARDASALMTQKYKHWRALFGEDTPAERVAEQREYTDIIEAIRDIKRAVLLGEPGAGKTTTLWRLAKALFDTAMADPKAPIPVLVRLGKWTQADEPLTVFVQHELGELGTHLDKLIADKRVVLLLDGLNEIPLAQRKAGKDEQVKALIEMAYKTNPGLIGVISCRERDYTLDLALDKIDIAPLDPLRIREFVTRYLDPVKGEGTGEAVFWRLVISDHKIRAVWRKWESAGATVDQFLNALHVPREKPNVYSVTNSDDDQIWQNRYKIPGTLLALAQNPYMLMMMTDIYRDKGALPDNRGELFTQFVDELIERESRTNERMAAREAHLTAALAKVANAMQSRREAGSKKAASASTALPLAEVTPALLDDELLYLAGSASILSTGDTVRFSHQLLQEYFAALYMMLEIKAGRLKATDLWKPANWWKPTGWEEAAILLVGMFPNQIDWLAAANPELAAQCIVRSGAAISLEALEKNRPLWIPRLTDLKSDPDPRSRAAVGRALGFADLDNRPGVGVRPLTPGPSPAGRGEFVPDIVWCEVPAGEFIYQDGEKRTLPAFQISKYPITYKQFQAFIDAPDGFSNPQWWQGLHPDGLKQQQGGPGDQEFKFWNHPREGVSWYDTMAFCRWLSARLDYEIMLPTEQQWEKAARGTDGRTYPYGDDFDQTKGNTTEAGIGQTSAVGVFPEGASPYGVFDLSGNVFEWTLTEYNSRSSTDITNNLSRVLRGGSWLSYDVFARAPDRYLRAPDDRHYDLGFRLVCAAPINEL